MTYTPPVPINRKKLLIRLITVFAAALALFLGCTVFFRVKDVVVTGNERYSAWTVREASGIEEGESLLAFGKTKAAGRIMEKLRYVRSVRIGITLPDTVNIHVQEPALSRPVRYRCSSSHFAYSGGVYGSVIVRCTEPVISSPMPALLIR